MSPGARRPSLTRSRALILALGLLVPCAVTVVQKAHGAIVERVVAIVGENAILLSDLKERSLPYLLRIYETVPAGPARAANISQLYRMVLETMIDEELEADAAHKAGIDVTDEQIDAAIEQTASQNGVSVNAILVEAKRSGLSIKNYREELRRQLTQRAMIEVRLRGRINVTENDLKKSYRDLTAQERMRQPQRTLALYLPLGSDEATRAKNRTLAVHVANLAKQGEDFRSLIDQYSSSTNSGLRPELPAAQEPPEIQRATLALEVGQTSDPIQFHGQWLIIQVIERPPSELPSYAEAREQIHERVYMEKIGSARKHWLEGLRRRTHVEVRL